MGEGKSNHKSCVLDFPMYTCLKDCMSYREVGEGLQKVLPLQKLFVKPKGGDGGRIGRILVPKAQTIGS